jgi:prepilin-type N-terminal cleavage/methylation domain-containing protein/prepilin-type processing-associated H-X9-DG protein
MKRAFTLIELLVVISIIAVLTALLLPTVTMARNSAKAVSCMSSQRQLGMAILVYVDDAHGILPTLVDNSPQYPGAASYWFERIAPYAGVGATGGPVTCFDIQGQSRTVIRGCPAYRDGPAWYPGYGMVLYPLAPLSFDHCYFYNGGWWGKRDIRLIELSGLDQRIIVGDSNDWHLSAVDHGMVGFWQENTRGLAVRRHGSDKANYLYGDGHVASANRREAWFGVADPLRSKN